MEFGRPSYFQGQPSTSKDSSSSSSVALGSDELIVGACWTGEKNLLVTSSSSVRVFHVDHVQEPLRTWNFRPDQQHALTSAAVFLAHTKKKGGGSSSKNGSSHSSHSTGSSGKGKDKDRRPSIVSIQNNRTLIAWDHDDEALSTLKSFELPSASHQLLSGLFPDVVTVVGNNGTITCFDPDLNLVGKSELKVDDEHISSAGGGLTKKSRRSSSSSSSSSSRPRRRSRSNSNISSTSNEDPVDEVLDWSVIWSRHAPVRTTREKATVLLYTLLRRNVDGTAHILVVHELTRALSRGGAIRIQLLSQSNVCDGGLDVKACTLGMIKGGSGSGSGGGGGGGGNKTSRKSESNGSNRSDICLQMVCGGRNEMADQFHVWTFPNGPRLLPKLVSSILKDTCKFCCISFKSGCNRYISYNFIKTGI